MVTMDDNKLFIDTNILVYAVCQNSPFQNKAIERIEFFSASNKSCWISRQVLREFLAVLSRPQPYSLGVPIDKLISYISFFEQRFNIAEDGQIVTNILLDILQSSSIGGKQIHDANIVATMLANDIHSLLTHNVEDFRRFTNLINVIPLLQE